MPRSAPRGLGLGVGLGLGSGVGDAVGAAVAAALGGAVAVGAALDVGLAEAAATAVTDARGEDGAAAVSSRPPRASTKATEALAARIKARKDTSTGVVSELAVRTTGAGTAATTTAPRR